MNKWNIVVDSSVDFKKEDFDSKNINIDIIPLQIIVKDKVFIDDSNLNVDELIEAMRVEKEGSKTACPAPGAFLESFKKADNTICLTITGKLSGTYNSACLASAMAIEEDNNKNIHVVDSHSTGGHLVLLVEKTLELINAGLSFDEVVKEIELYNLNIQVVAILGSFDNLVKTGRMSPVVGKIANHLNIKAIAENTKDGEIVAIRKTRGLQQAYSALFTIMNNKKDLSCLPIVISHCNNLNGATKIKELIISMYPNASIRITSCGGLTSFYVMEHGVIIGF